jgi:hypothetical protein
MKTTMTASVLALSIGCGDTGQEGPATEDGVVKQFDGKSDAWNWRNDPTRFRTDLNYTFADLPKEGASEHIAWAGTYWPYYQDGINDRWQGNDTFSPAEKYDQAFKSWAPADGFMDLKPYDNSTCEWDDAYYDALGPVATWTAKNKGNWTAHNGTDDDGDGIADKDECKSRAMSTADNTEISNEKKYDGVETWWGICHAWAPAALMEKEPLKAITKNGVTFEVSDIKALLMSLYDRTDAYMLGGRCNDNDEDIERDETGRIMNEGCRDLNAGTFHVIITNFLGVNKRGLVTERTWDYEVWNQPLVGYKITSEKEINVDEAHNLLKINDEGTGEFVYEIEEGTSDARTVLALANDGTYTELDEGARLDRRAAQNIIDARPIRSLKDLDSVRYVGEASFGKMLAFAKDNGFTNTTYVYNKDATRFVEIKMTTDYITESHASVEPTTSVINRYVRHDNYHYIVEMNDAGEIIGGEWVGSSIAGHPDFFWLPVRARGGNPYLDMDTVRDMVAESREDSDTNAEPDTDAREFSSEGNVAIPDNTAEGAKSVIRVDASGTIRDLTVNVNIDHTYRGDLIVELRHGGISMRIFDGSTVDQPWNDDVVLTDEAVDAFAGSEMNGEWELFVVDTARADNGKIMSWSLNIR